MSVINSYSIWFYAYYKLTNIINFYKVEFNISIFRYKVIFYSVDRNKISIRIFLNNDFIDFGIRICSPVKRIFYKLF